MRPTQTATPTTTVHFRTGPGTTYPTVAGEPELFEGAILSVLGVENGWAHLQDTYRALDGWADATYLEISTVTTFFIPDIYYEDASANDLDFDQLALDARYFGAILKATQGIGDSDEETDWFVAQWPLLGDAGGEDYGTSWFRGCYHFLDLAPPSGTSPAAWGEAQAEFFMSVVLQAGGLGAGDLPPIVDVEVAGLDGTTQTNEVIEQIVSAWAGTVQAGLGRKPMIYRRSQDSDFPGLQSQMGCSFLWAKRYDDELGTLTDGFTSAALWQYTDGEDEDPRPDGYPYDAPGVGPIDTSVLLYGDGSLTAAAALVAASLSP